MPKYTLDTNIFVDALRSPSAAIGLKRFLAVSLPSTWMNAVVMMELRSGARTPEQVTALEGGLLDPFSRRGRVLVPTTRAFREAGRVLRSSQHPRAADRVASRPAGRATELPVLEPGHWLADADRLRASLDMPPLTAQRRPVTARQATHGSIAESPVGPRHRAMFCEGFRPATPNPPPTYRSP